MLYRGTEGKVLFLKRHWLQDENKDWFIHVFNGTPHMLFLIASSLFAKCICCLGKLIHCDVADTCQHFFFFLTIFHWQKIILMFISFHDHLKIAEMQLIRRSLDPFFLLRLLNYTGLFSWNDVMAITLLFLNETEFFNFCQDPLDIHFVYGYLGVENPVPVWHSGAGKQGLWHP